MNSSKANPSAKIQILVVEDEVIVAESTRIMLDSLGFQVTDVVGVGAEALASIESRRPDLVLMDVHLHGELDGVSVSEQIRSQWDIPVVFVTAYADEQTLERAKLTGPFGYIVKPFEERDLQIAIEITLHRHDLERRLKESSQFNQEVITNVQEGIVVYDRELRCQVWNGFMERLTGVLAKDVLGRAITDVFPIMKEMGLDKTLSRALSGKIIQSADFRMQLSPKGRTVWLSDCHAPFRNASGEIIGVIATVRNTTERKLAEEALKQSEDRYRRLVEVSPDAIYIQCDGKFVFLNPAALRLFGAQNPEQLMGRSVLEMVHPDFRGVASDRLKIMQNTSQSVPLIEEKYLRLDRTPVEVETIASPFSYMGSPAAHVIVRDISERKRMESRLLRTQRMEIIGALASGIAHDLNNVLSPIMMSVQYLRDTCPDPQSQEMLETLQKSADRAAQIVKQLLTFGRGVSQDKTVLSSKHLLQEMKKIAVETFPRSLTIDISYPSSPWPILGDATQLHQVLLNLCVNARDAMPEGGTLTLKIDNVELDDCYARMDPEAKPGPYVLITVSDTGAGISPKIMDQIFEPFFTTKAPGHGTGLGLPTALNIVKGHGGFIRVSSQPGQGTQFKVYLPAAPSEILDSTPLPIFHSPRGRGEAILVVDDEPSIRNIARNTLEKKGYCVITAHDGTDALVQYVKHEEKIQVALVDLMMPIMDGASTIRALRRLDPHLRVIVMSGVMTHEQEANLKGMQVDGFLSKPFSTEQLFQTLQGLWDAQIRAEAPR